MALATVHSRAAVGLNAPEVTVEVHLAGGLPSMTVVGLPEAAVREAKDRVRAAIVNSGYEYPRRRITVNLAPADLPKDGGRFDLPMAIGILAASGQIQTAGLAGYEFLGELSLGAELRPVRALLPALLAAQHSGRRMIVPQDCTSEAALARDADVGLAAGLSEVVAELAGSKRLPGCPDGMATATPPGIDLSEVRGQPAAKRAL